MGMVSCVSGLVTDPPAGKESWADRDPTQWMWCMTINALQSGMFQSVGGVGFGYARYEHLPNHHKGKDLTTPQTCSTSRKIRGTHVSYHMTQCGAQCGNCFAAEWKVLLECKCEDRRRRSYDTSTEPSTLWRDREVWLERHLCRDCSKEATETLLDWREGRDRHDHHQAVRESLNCLTCREPIQDAVPLWWVCKTCKFECRSLEHPWRKEVNV
ncbi:hypothetical protein BJX63DRAFT_390580 [Aspergillus granulosus]|uniref:Uncharacterized protein n=1 Tax=Aspergillus granulosus TaxID=176169 RepID=A0ABR4HK77_9EURO